MDERSLQSNQNKIPQYPPGFENWPLERKEEFMRGKPEEPESPAPENLQTSPAEKAKEWFKNLSGEKRAEAISALIDEAKQMKGPEDNADNYFTQNKLPPRRGFEPAAKTEIETEAVKPIVPPAENIFSDPSLLKHESVIGDTLWQILERAFENMKGVENLTKAQKIYVLNLVAGKIFESPEMFGLDKSGELKIGDRIDLTGLNSMASDINKIIREAKDTITEGSSKERETLNLPKQFSPEPAAKDEPHIVEKDEKAQVMEEIEAAKKRLSELTQNPSGQVVPIDFKKPIIERSLHSDMRAAKGVNESAKRIDETFRNGIDKIYGKRKLWGSKVEGIRTEEWEEINRYTAKELVQYTEGESERGKLSPNLLKTLGSPQNQELIKELVYLMSQTGNILKPREKEHPGEFMLRLIEFVSRNQPQQLDNSQKAA